METARAGASPAPDITVTVAPFRAWRGSRLIVAEKPTRAAIEAHGSKRRRNIPELAALSAANLCPGNPAHLGPAATAPRAGCRSAKTHLWGCHRADTSTRRYAASAASGSRPGARR